VLLLHGTSGSRITSLKKGLWNLKTDKTSIIIIIIIIILIHGRNLMRAA
jgi:hypothetical protein